MVLGTQFSCVGAKAAFNSDSYAFHAYGQLGSLAATQRLARDLEAFTRSSLQAASEFATCVAVFASPIDLSEAAFEKLLWQQLQMLHEVDTQRWDRAVSSDPTDPHFSFSFAGQALYVVGMHANSSRRARQFPWPALVFNPHVQFEKLRSDGKWKRMQQTIREREMQLQGSINPMIHDFGESSEARQYSGREVNENWRCPFH
jgi:FPC/CPF motif-containing protein YcgG